jgi:hypothetical protein
MAPGNITRISRLMPQNISVHFPDFPENKISGGLDIQEAGFRIPGI